MRSNDPAPGQEKWKETESSGGTTLTPSPSSALVVLINGRLWPLKGIVTFTHKGVIVEHTETGDYYFVTVPWTNLS